MEHEPAPRVIDQIVGAVSRYVVAEGPTVAQPHYPQIHSTLSGLVEHEPAPHVIDQIVEAVSRYVVAVGQA